MSGSAGVVAPSLVALTASLDAASSALAGVDVAGLEVAEITAAVDERLNEKGYILPGLGDAGDRIFGTRME